MNITVLGAAGKTGIQVAEQALAARHKVNGLVRHDDTLNERPHLIALVGDATNQGDVAKASNGSDVIISVLGGL